MTQLSPQFPPAPIYVGCAGWSIPRILAENFGEGGSHLERYATRFNAVEINSSFYRPHRRQTYSKWASQVPDDFRFAIKIPKAITHQNRLKNVNFLLDEFLEQVVGLGKNLGSLLVQLPPSLNFEVDVSAPFFVAVRERFEGRVVCEPRHPSWFVAEADSLLRSFQIARVVADPALNLAAIAPGGWSELAYYRLHGSPVIYRSAYSPDFIAGLGNSFRKRSQSGTETWCIFDNTAEDAATSNALELQQAIL